MGAACSLALVSSRGQCANGARKWAPFAEEITVGGERGGSLSFGLGAINQAAAQWERLVNSLIDAGLVLANRRLLVRSVADGRLALALAVAHLVPLAQRIEGPPRRVNCVTIVSLLLPNQSGRLVGGCVARGDVIDWRRREGRGQGVVRLLLTLVASAEQIGGGRMLLLLLVMLLLVLLMLMVEVVIVHG